MRVQHRHQSLNTRMGRENPDAVTAALAEHRSHCTVLTGTEGQLGGLLRAPDWGVFRGEGPYNRDDPWVSWETSVWHRRSAWVVQLSDVTYDGRRAHCAVAVLDHWRTGATVAFMATHLPAHIGRRIRTRRLETPREKAYNESLAQLRETVRHMRRAHPGRHVVLVADWNLEMRSPFVRRKLRYALRDTGLHLVPVPRGERGTHGRRLIDWAFTTLTSTGDVLELTDASDHRGVAFTHED